MHRLRAHWFPMSAIVAFSVWILSRFILFLDSGKTGSAVQETKGQATESVWVGPNAYTIPDYSDSGRLIAYGYRLIANTSYYLGPRGTVAHATNGMNCQNCHLDAGTKPWGNNYGGVYATYPQFRARSNAVQSIYDRINDCFQRSLNGKRLDTTAKEMQAMYAYIKWVGENVAKGKKPYGSGIRKLPYLDRAADPVKGAGVYQLKCAVCHGSNGQGVPEGAGGAYKYPPLWGAASYNDGAGMYRISNLAGFLIDNMPYGVDFRSPQLTTEEAWDLAAFINSRRRPHKDQSKDWKNLAAKPIDLPFGPYVDSFSRNQHKFGPFSPIQQAHAKKVI